MYCSLSGGSLLLHPSSLPLENNVVFPPCLDVAVGARWWARTQVCGDAAVVVEGWRPSVYVLLLDRRLVPLVGWLVFSVSIFAGWTSWGASRPDREKDSLKFNFVLSFWVPYPSKSGLLNKHIVKHISFRGVERFQEHVSFLVSCTCLKVRTNTQTYRKHIVKLTLGESRLLQVLSL